MKDYKEKMRNLYNKVRFSALIEDAYVAKKLEEAFPELKEESEEESFRTYIIMCCKETIAADDRGLELSMGTTKRLLAWLEKQGEQKHTAEEILIKAGLKPYKDGDQWCILLGDNIQEGICGFGNTIEDALYAFLKDLIASQGEQKPADMVEPKFKVKYAGSEYNVFDTIDIAGVTFYGIEDEPNHIDYVKAENCEIISGYGIKENGSPYPTKPAKFSEHNPTWSEDDEKMWLSAIEYVRTHPAQTRSVVEWLKSLKERVIPQPKQEWSEEDEIGLGNALRAIEQARTIAKSENDMGNLWYAEKWLKSFKPQDRWKPSEEQMEALDSAIHCYAGVSPTNNREVFALEIMKEQLKKLRGE